MVGMAGDVQRRVGVDRAAHVVDDDVAALALLDVVIHIAQMDHRFGRQHGQVNARLGLHRQRLIGLQLGQQRRAAQTLHRQQRQRFQVCFVDKDGHRRVDRRRLRRVTVLQRQRHALVAHPKEIGWQPYADADVARVITGDIECLRAGQFGKLDRPVRPQPIGCVIGLAGVQLRRLCDGHALPDQRLGPGGQGGGRHLQLLAVAPLHQQQFAVWIVRVDDDGQRRTRRVALAGQRQAGQPRFATEKYDRIALGRQRIDAGRKAQHAAVGPQSEPGSQRSGGFQRGVVGYTLKHHRQTQFAAVTVIEEGLGQQGQIIGQRGLGGAQRQHALIADGGPQTGMLWVFAGGGVVANQLQGELVELRNHVGRQLDLAGDWPPAGLLGQGQAGGHLTIDQDIDFGEFAEHVGRIGVGQLERRPGDHLVGAHTERDVEATIDTAQIERFIPAELLEGQAVAAGVGRPNGKWGLRGLRDLGSLRFSAGLGTQPRAPAQHHASHQWHQREAQRTRTDWGFGDQGHRSFQGLFGRSDWVDGVGPAARRRVASLGSRSPALTKLSRSRLPIPTLITSRSDPSGVSGLAVPQSPTQ